MAARAFDLAALFLYGPRPPFVTNFPPENYAPALAAMAGMSATQFVSAIQGFAAAGGAAAVGAMGGASARARAGAPAAGAVAEETPVAGFTAHASAT